jgi:glyoxylase-like metal-dependent hydrolase (beta-lactamase superfamily II)
MLKRERVAENVYSFQSDVYAQVNAGAVVGSNWAVVIDTLALPEETLEIRRFIEQELQVPVRYLINTHYHADHTWGNYLFPSATILSRTLCRELLDTRGRASLEAAKKQGTSFQQVRIVLPHLTFAEGTLSIRIGKKTITLTSFPGHSPDNLGVIVVEDRVMFAGDVFMPIPYIVDGNVDDMITSLKTIAKMGLENVIQGHGDIVLRGEIEGSVKDNLAYLSAIRRAVRKAGRRKYPMDMLEDVGVEECGKSRILIGGLAEELHQRNLYAMYEQLYGEPPASSDDEED